MKQVCWGIIGCGDVTEVKSGPAFNKVNNSKLVAVMRRDAEKAKDYARRHQVPRWYNDAHQLINDPEVNAIYVATPPSSHEEYAIAALAAGKPVYVEKPMSQDYDAACRMTAFANEKKLPLTVAHYRRQQPRFKRVKQLVQEKAIGDVLLVRLELTKPPLTTEEMKNPSFGWRVDPAIAGGGMFHDLGTHQLDLMYYFFGAVSQANGIATNQRGQYAADDMVAGSILFENKVAFSGTWCFNAAPELTTDQVEIIGTRGRIRCSIFSGHSITVTANGKTATETFEVLQHVQQPMIEAVVAYFSGEGDNPCTGEEGTEVMRLMEAIVKR